MTEVGETSEELRWRVLALLVPHLCHKLNNAIGVVQGLSDLLLRRATDPRDHQQLTAVFQQANRAAELIASIGDYTARGEARQEFVDLADVARAAVSVVGPIFKDTGGKLDSRLGEGTFVCSTNPRRLLQVLVILAAAPYTPLCRSPLARPAAPPRVRITLSRSANAVVLRVTHSDRGANREAETSLALAPELEGIGARVAAREFSGWRSVRFAF